MSTIFQIVVVVLAIIGLATLLVLALAIPQMTESDREHDRDDDAGR